MEVRRVTAAAAGSKGLCLFKKAKVLVFYLHQQVFTVCCQEMIRRVLIDFQRYRMPQDGTCQLQFTWLMHRNNCNKFPGSGDTIEIGTNQQLIVYSLSVILGLMTYFTVKCTTESLD